MKHAAVLIFIFTATLFCLSQDSKPKQVSPLNPTAPPDTPEGLITYLLPDNLAHPDRIQDVSRDRAVDALTKAQPDARGAKADAIAYLLVILGADPDANRSRLIDSLRACTRDPEPCDDRLISYMSDLFQRGDKFVLDPLLDAAKVNDSLLTETLSSSYQDMILQDTRTVITAISRRSLKDQRSLCKMIATGDGSGFPSDSTPKLTSSLEEMARGLGPIASTAMVCVTEVRTFAKH